VAGVVAFLFFAAPPFSETARLPRVSQRLQHIIAQVLVQTFLAVASFSLPIVVAPTPFLATGFACGGVELSVASFIDQQVGVFSCAARLWW